MPFYGVNILHMKVRQQRMRDLGGGGMMKCNERDVI